MSIGAGETFEKAVVHFAEGRMANIPGLMLTAFTRVKAADDLAVGTESNSLTVNDITKIGATKAYKKKKNFGNSSRFSLSSQCREPSIALQHWIIKTLKEHLREVAISSSNGIEIISHLPLQNEVIQYIIRCNDHITEQLQNAYTLPVSLYQPTPFRLCLPSASAPLSQT